MNVRRRSMPRTRAVAALPVVTYRSKKYPTRLHAKRIKRVAASLKALFDKLEAFFSEDWEDSELKNAILEQLEEKIDDRILDKESRIKSKLAWMLKKLVIGDELETFEESEEVEQLENTISEKTDGEQKENLIDKQKTEILEKTAIEPDELEETGIEPEESTVLEMSSIKMSELEESIICLGTPIRLPVEVVTLEDSPQKTEDSPKNIPTCDNRKTASIEISLPQSSWSAHF